jgi:phage protein U
MYAVLGEIEFDLITYFDGMEARFGSDYAEHALIGGKPALQFVGDKLDEIRIDLVFHATYCHPEAELTRLRGAMQLRTALALVLGNGDYKGRFVITELQATGRHTDRTGSLLAAEAQLSLKEFTGQARKPQAPALQGLTSARLPASRVPLAKPFPQASGVLLKANAGGLGLAVARAKSALATTHGVIRTLQGLRSLAGRDPLAVIGRLPGVMRDAQGVLPGLGLASVSIQQFGQLAATAGDTERLAKGLARVKSDLASLPGLLSGADGHNLPGKLSAAGGLSERTAQELDALAVPLARLAAKAATRSTLS